MKRSNSIVLLVTSVLLAVVQSGCMTVGYSYAKDPKRVSATPITITHIQPQNIYNSAGVYWVGPFAKVESRGQEITVVEANGKSTKLVQPLSDKYELRVGQEAVCIINRGQIWVQPTDYPLPPEFDALSTKSSPLPTPYESSVTITLPQGWKKEPLPDSMKSNSAKLLFAQNVTSDCQGYKGRGAV